MRKHGQMMDVDRGRNGPGTMLKTYVRPGSVVSIRGYRRDEIADDGRRRKRGEEMKEKHRAAGCRPDQRHDAGPDKLCNGVDKGPPPHPRCLRGRVAARRGRGSADLRIGDRGRSAKGRYLWASTR